MRNQSTGHSGSLTTDECHKLDGQVSTYLHARRCCQRPNLRLLAGLLLTFSAAVSVSALITDSAIAQGTAHRSQSSFGSDSPADGPVSDSKVREDLHRILQQQEFQPDKPSSDNLSKSVKSLFAELRKQWDRLVKWFNDLFGMGAMTGGSRVLTYIIVGLLICLLIPIVYYLIRNRTRIFVGGTILPRPTAKEEEALPDIVRDLTFWEKEAADWEAKQNYRQALRARFIFLLLTLDGVNLISYHRARTTGDYLHDLEDRPERTGEWALPEALRTLVPTLIRELEPLAHAFDRAWYGPTETTEEEYTPLKAIILRTTRQLASQPGKQTTSKATPVVEGSANL